MVLLLMQLSHTKLTKIDTSAHSRLLIHLSTSRARKELVMPATMLLSFYTLRDLKIFPLSTESEISLEFTEPPSDSTMVKDNSMPTFSTVVHGLCSQLTRNLLFKKLEAKMLEVTSFPSLSQENITLLKSQKLLLFKISENGLNNTLLNTTLFQTICLLL
jgi:hypothetical protein